MAEQIKLGDKTVTRDEIYQCMDVLDVYLAYLKASEPYAHKAITTLQDTISELGNLL